MTDQSPRCGEWTAKGTRCKNRVVGGGPCIHHGGRRRNSSGNQTRNPVHTHPPSNSRGVVSGSSSGKKTRDDVFVDVIGVIIFVGFIVILFFIAKSCVENAFGSTDADWSPRTEQVIVPSVPEGTPLTTAPTTSVSASLAEPDCGMEAEAFAAIHNRIQSTVDDIVAATSFDPSDAIMSSSMGLSQTNNQLANGFLEIIRGTGTGAYRSSRTIEVLPGAAPNQRVDSPEDLTSAAQEIRTAADFLREFIALPDVKPKIGELSDELTGHVDAILPGYWVMAEACFNGSTDAS